MGVTHVMEPICLLIVDVMCNNNDKNCCYGQHGQNLIFGEAAILNSSLLIISADRNLTIVL